MIIYVYTLVDPLYPKDIRYIGITSNIDRRFAAHMRESKKKGSYKNHWINSLLKNNRIPIINIIDTVSEINWSEKEKYWIQYYKNLGHILVNGNSGGIGSRNPSEATRLKLSNSIKKSWLKRNPNILSSNSKYIISQKAKERFSKMSEHEKRELSLKAYTIKMLITTPIQRSESAKKAWKTKIKNGNIRISNQSICKIENCTNMAKAKGYCSKHYQYERAKICGWKSSYKKLNKNMGLEIYV